MLRKKSRNDKFGFTLAEVLVTLGVIGVVSAMTVPTLMQNYQKKSYVVQLHKVYNEIQQALMQYQTERNAINLTEAGLISKSSVEDLFNSYFKVVRFCKGNSDDCFASSYKYINGNSVSTADVWTGSCATLTSGASLCMDYPTLYNKTYGRVFIDVNAKKGPNILGRDAFYLAVFPDGVLDVIGANINCRLNGQCGSYKSLKEVRGTVDDCKAGRQETTRGSCFGQILNDNWEMNY